MPLSTFLTFLAFLTRKLGWSRADQKTLPEIRREALARAAEQTRSLLDDLVRAVVTTKTGGRAIHRWQVSSLLFFGAPAFLGHQRQKGQKGQKGECVS
jgi:hypothetical protein